MAGAAGKPVADPEPFACAARVGSPLSRVATAVPRRALAAAAVDDGWLVSLVMARPQSASRCPATLKREPQRHRPATMMRTLAAHFQQDGQVGA
jgi:hypothetical protein